MKSIILISFLISKPAFAYEKFEFDFGNKLVSQYYGKSKYFGCIAYKKENQIICNNEDPDDDIPKLKNPVQVSAGSSHTCALHDKGVKCWGSNEYGEALVPELKNPVQVSAGKYHTCVLHDKGVKCWGPHVWQTEYEQQTISPWFKNPVQISAGSFHNCALHDEGVSCWGREKEGQSDVPLLEDPKIVSAGAYHNCALDNKGVKCWGLNEDGQTDVPPLENPKMVSAGAGHTCALDNTGVKCWGSNKSGQANVPDLKNPIQVSAGAYHTCALDNTGVKCWGLNKSGQANVPDLKNPIHVRAGAYHTCAIDDSGVKCWGWNQDEMANEPQLKSPVYVSVSENDFACAIDKVRIKCWGKNAVTYGIINVPELNNPIKVSVGPDHACAIDEKSVKCWGQRTLVEELKKPSDIYTSERGTCAIDNDGLRCWELYKYAQSEYAMRKLLVKKNLNPVFRRVIITETYDIDTIIAIGDIWRANWITSWHGDDEDFPSVYVYKYNNYVEQLSEFGDCVILGKLLRCYPNSWSFFAIMNIANTSTPTKASFLDPLLLFDKYFYKVHKDMEAPLLGFIISPLVLNHDSKFYKDVMIPEFTNWFSDILNNSAKPLTIDDVEGSLENREIALTAIQSSLDVSLSFLSGHQIDRTQDALRKVGQAMIDPMNNQNILEAVKSVESLTEERAVLLSSDKSKFLIECQQVAIDWLKLKVK